MQKKSPSLCFYPQRLGYRSPILFPYTTLFRSYINNAALNYNWRAVTRLRRIADHDRDRKSTRLNSSHSQTSYSVFCLKNQEYVFAERAAHTFLLFGYVVMPDHLHLLMAPLHSG